MVVAAGASSATNVWAFTDQFGKSRALRWNGRHWTAMRSFSRAIGGAGLIFTEMTCVGRDARITPGCTGLWNDEQETAWRRIVVEAMVRCLEEPARLGLIVDRPIADSQVVEQLVRAGFNLAEVRDHFDDVKRRLET